MHRVALPARRREAGARGTIAQQHAGLVAGTLPDRQHRHERGAGAWWYSLDFNERCQNVVYLLEFLAKVREQAQAASERVA